MTKAGKKILNKFFTAFIVFSLALYFFQYVAVFAALYIALKLAFGRGRFIDRVR